MERIQKRVGLTSNVISNMKHLRISGLSVPVEKLIQKMRVDELNTASRFRTIYVTVVTFGYLLLNHLFTMAPLNGRIMLTFAV